MRSGGELDRRLITCYTRRLREPKVDVLGEEQVVFVACRSEDRCRESMDRIKTTSSELCD